MKKYSDEEPYMKDDTGIFVPEIPKKNRIIEGLLGFLRRLRMVLYGECESPNVYWLYAESPHVYTKTSNGRKYVIADEFIRLPEFRRQIPILKRIFG